MTESVLAIASSVRRRERSALEAVDDALAAISRTNPEVGAFCALDPDRAREAARRIDARIAAGDDPGPLAGVPFGVKDLEAAEGYVTTFGDPAHAHDARAAADSVEVARLRAAGAIVVGKTNTPVYGLHAETDNLVFGPTRNPHALGRTCGGSSGGSAAAIAAGMVPLCTGSDGGGSIRIPSAVCGLSGFKPTHGVVPNGDATAPTWGAYSTRGPMAATFGEIAYALDAVTGLCDRDLLSFDLGGSFGEAVDRASLDGVRVVWSATLGYANPDPRLVAALEAALEALAANGARIVERDDAVFETAPVRAWFPRAAAGAWRTANLDPTPLEQRFLPAAMMSTMYGERVTAAQIVEGESGAHEANLRLTAVWERADVLITPATPVLAPKVGESSPYGPAWASEYTLPFNLVRAPAAVVRCGWVDDDGERLPVAIQIAAPRCHDYDLMAIAAAAEAALF
jgi:aspartyl-tRNA(Asn)/glutamyl-tRNA(Gln) amidotransferase subunit A